MASPWLPILPKPSVVSVVDVDHQAISLPVRGSEQATFERPVTHRKPCFKSIPNRGDWERYRSEISSRYGKSTLKDLMKYMQNKYNFHAK